MTPRAAENSSRPPPSRRLGCSPTWRRRCCPAGVRRRRWSSSSHLRVHPNSAKTLTLLAALPHARQREIFSELRFDHSAGSCQWPDVCSAARRTRPMLLGSRPVREYTVVTLDNISPFRTHAIPISDILTSQTPALLTVHPTPSRQVCLPMAPSDHGRS